MSRPDRVAVVYGSAPGTGGLGQSVSAAITAAANGAMPACALGPAARTAWSLAGGTPPVQWITSVPPGIPSWQVRYTWLRWRSGRVAYLRDQALGQWAAGEVARLQPRFCYAFTQVALESLRWARRAGVPTAIDNPNGHIRNFQQVCERESQRWFGKKSTGHPSPAMLDRIEEEYQLADQVRMYSSWGQASMTSFGVPAEKIHVIRQTINLERFRPAATWPNPSGPLRICYVGSLDLRKGFVYLLKAIRMIGAKHIRLQIAGATGDRDCARLFARESAGLQVEAAPADSLPVYRQSELLVVPTLEDGLPFVLVEGLACGLPTIVTREAGAAECVRDGCSGWVVPAAEVEPLAAALEQALRLRSELPAMGRQARRDVEQYAGPAQLRELSEWFSIRAGASTVLK